MRGPQPNWTGVLEVDAAFRAWKEAESNYDSVAREIMRTENGSWSSPKRAELPALNDRADALREALDNASRLLDQVCGNTVARLLRIGCVDKAITVIRRLVCHGCHARAIPDGGETLFCRKCRRKNERAESAPAVIDEAEEVAEVLERVTSTTEVVFNPVSESPVPPDELSVHEPSPPVSPPPSEASSMPSEASFMSVNDASLLPVDSGDSRAATERKTMAVGDTTMKSNLAKLREAHEDFERACEKLSKANGNAASVWSEVSDAEIGVAKARAAVMGCLLGLATKAKSFKIKGEPLYDTAPPKPAKKTASSKFAEWLRAARMGTGLSQEAFGQKVGASYTQMYHWEKGSRVPDDDIISKIEKLVGKNAPS